MAATAINSKRNWIYAKMPKGIWYQRRQWVGYSLLLIFFVLPFIKIGGQPLLMLNVVERKFAVLGLLFYPQDLYIFVFGMMIVLVAIVLITAMAGRVWCGWACPQTIFMELVFRRIEYWIEGDWIQQRRTNEGPDTDARAWKKLLKHSLFLLLSFLIANLFLAYIIGVDALWRIVKEPVEQHLVGFLSLITFTLVFYGVFAHLREIVCTTICPYGRLQSVLLDESTITVAYDHRRGEPRGKYKREAPQNLGMQGDCVDCKLCVHVCPTGIDIRNGIQLECVNCTACVDACDAVMEKLHKPKRLVGFYSAATLEGELKKRKGIMNRTWAYTAILLVLSLLFSFLLAGRSLIDGRLLRAAGSSYQLRDDGTVSNLYTLELTNKSGKDMPFTLKSEDATISLQRVNAIDSLKPDGKAMLSFFLCTPNHHVKKYKTDVKVQIISNSKVIKSLKTTFIAPTGKRDKS
ncbi:cytochrome c oxidase accessory protein CcoG [Sphingobacterium sp. lm-10]|uniref:cytochrome c oxidase accessory protein CcoG n=1 Tax=Sphingobacterium sp. lm-10 TaxID=2944904 RepID=UPI0020209BA2|nr:cytochrome c oxidase accessory protein CcoG [Sphingobacterium sp. lm-10]MCL7986324.1 cytochrome c oxidase accessory protein CcoG [Sphingobacterium sp. lm-10]